MNAPDHLFILACDHRASLPATLGLAPQPGDEPELIFRDAKEMVFLGLLEAARSIPAGSVGFLVDEEFGAGVAPRVKPQGVFLAMPVEKSGSDLFEFAYPDWQEHIERFDPDFVKVLVRWNPKGNANDNRMQGERLSRLSSWLYERRRPLLLELLVPATEAQLAAVAQDTAVYDRTIRPGLACEAIEAIYSAGVEPSIWKVEGVNERAQAEQLVSAARAGGRAHARCVVLGRGAEIQQVDEWLRIAARVPGFCGFAVGRSIWAEAIRSWIRDRSSVDEAIGEIAGLYRQFVDVYLGAEAEERHQRQRAHDRPAAH
jgi:myo-inositol catabolism protein IolC